MPCSAAQLAANRANALKSTGPKTPEGKDRARRNGLKHGLTGQGVVIAAADADEAARRYETLEIEMAPKHDLARQLVGRVALITLKLDRSSEQETKTISHAMRHAIARFDDTRLAEVEKAYSWLAAEPATHARRLRTSPEGIDRILASMHRLKDDLSDPEGIRWGWEHSDHLHHLMGLRRLEVPASRPRALSEAIDGNFQYLRQSEGGDLAKGDRQPWAVEQLLGLIEGEIAKLVELRGNLDLETLALDRAEAPARAMFDGSKESILARKYEAANERALYRALKEFREVNAMPAEVVAEQELTPEPAEELASPEVEIPDQGDEDAELDATPAKSAPEIAPNRTNLAKQLARAQARGRSRGSAAG